MCKGELAQALPLFEEHLAGLRRRLGDDLAETKAAVANLKWLQTDHAAALSHAQAAKERRKQNLEAQLNQIRSGENLDVGRTSAVSGTRSGEGPRTVGLDGIRLDHVGQEGFFDS